jgi:hypothetical protein
LILYNIFFYTLQPFILVYFYGHDHDGKDIEELKLSAANNHIQVSHLKAAPYLMMVLERLAFKF